MSEYLLGIDIGTSATKTVLFDTTGQQIASASMEYELYQPHPGWAEQNPEDWWIAVKRTMKKVMIQSSVGSEEVKGIGLSGQMHGLVLLDELYNVIRPSIIWCDQRTQAQCDYMTEVVGNERLIQMTGNQAITGFTASKILWVRDNEPELYAKIKHILLPKDYIRFKLTGVFATEVSDASGMQLLDIETRDWNNELLEILKIDKNLLSKVYESAEVTGYVTEDIAETVGLIEGIPVVGGAGDQAAGAIGNGIIDCGNISATIGTSGVVFAYTKRPLKDPKGRIQTFCHAIPDTWHVMGVTQGAGLSMRWFRDEFCQEESDLAEQLEVDPYEIMTKKASEAPLGSKGLIYLPYLMGERTPHLDPDAKGVFFGLTPSHTKSEMLRAIMEGVTFSLKDCLDLINEMGISVDEIRVSGGGSRSELWRRIQADVFGKGVSTIHASEGPALGVAILAGVGTGIYPSVKEACNQLISYGEPQEPLRSHTEVYRYLHEVYQKLYTNLRGAFKTHSQLLAKLDS